MSLKRFNTFEGVFTPALLSILGVIMYLRLGWVVGQVGLSSALIIIVAANLITLATALSMSSVVTNIRIGAGGAHSIIAKSLGIEAGGAIGIPLYLSQAISVAFYMIAFAEAFSPLTSVFETSFGIQFDPRIISIPATLGLLALMLYKGADMGVKALYGVAAILILSIIMFFLGSPIEGVDQDMVGLSTTIADADPFFVVFAIVFPAFTAGRALKDRVKK